MLVNGSLSLGAVIATGHDAPAQLLSTIPSLYTNVTEPPSSPSSLTSTSTVHLELSHGGCSLDGRGSLSNGPFDCLDKCRNQTALFTDAHTLYNCAVLSAAALLVQNGSLALDVANLTEADNLLHFGSLQTFDWRSVMTDLLACTKATCDSEMYGYCGGTIYSTQPSFYRLEDFTKILDRLCTPRGNLYNSMPDNDVAGPGLTTAYFLQAGLGLWFHVTSNLLSYWSELFISLLGFIQTAIQCISRRGKRPRSKGKHPTTQKLASLLQPVRVSRPATAVFSSLAEFQEAQVFFVIALQIAALVVYGKHGWEPADFVDAHSAAFFAAVTPLIAFMTQSSLQRAGRRWWYTFILTLIVYILAVDVDQTMLVEFRMKPLDQCGGSENVLPSCLSPRSDNTVGGRYAMRLGRVVVGCSHFIMALLAVDQLGHYSLPKWVPRPNWLTAANNHVSKLVSNTVVGRVLRLRWLTIDVMIFVLLSSYLGNIDYDIYWLFLERPDWDYGQIVAVLPWMPVFFKYVYLTLCEFLDPIPILKLATAEPG